jgi:outer membrane lipoprotein SlyB
MRKREPACLLLLLLLAVAAGCSAQRPALYPNERLKQVGSTVAERDIDECMREGEAHLASGGRAGKIAESAAAGAGAGAAVGAAAGAAGGAVAGHAGRGAAVGAAGGVAGGLTGGAIRGLFGSRAPDPALRNYVNRCLRDRGYEVIGWR